MHLIRSLNGSVSVDILGIRQHVLREATCGLKIAFLRRMLLPALRECSQLTYVVPDLADTYAFCTTKRYLGGSVPSVAMTHVLLLIPDNFTLLLLPNTHRSTIIDAAISIISTSVGQQT